MRIMAPVVAESYTSQCPFLSCLVAYFPACMTPRGPGGFACMQGPWEKAVLCATIHQKGQTQDPDSSVGECSHHQLLEYLTADPAPLG